MNKIHSIRRRSGKARFQRWALAYLVLLGGLAVVGPWGTLAWSENAELLEQRQARIAELEKESAVLENSVALLDPDSVDPDLASELIRRNLGVAHPDEDIVELE